MRPCAKKHKDAAKRGSTLFGTLCAVSGAPASILRRSSRCTRRDPFHQPIARFAVPINGTASEILSKLPVLYHIRPVCQHSEPVKSARFLTESETSVPLMLQTFVYPLSSGSSASASVSAMICALFASIKAASEVLGSYPMRM